MKRKMTGLLTLILLGTNLIACGQTQVEPANVTEVASRKDVTVEISENSTAKKGTRDNSSVVMLAEASGVEVYTGKDAILDTSNIADGYVCVKYTGQASTVRVLIQTPKDNTYNYLMVRRDDYEVYPLSEGNGSYKIGVYENVVDDKFAAVLSQNISVELTDEYGPFLYANSYVDFDDNSVAVEKSKELAESADTDLDVVESIYHYVTQNVVYDYDKAKTVKAGYYPSVDETLKTGKGICFDFAALMVAMLRSQGVPTKLEMGYAGPEYHAWISVYIEEIGWVDDIISFDGSVWTLMDPTLASYASSKRVKERWDSKDTHYQLKFEY